MARVIPARHTMVFHFAFPRGSSCMIISTFSHNSSIGIVPKRGGVINCAAHGDNNIPTGFGGCFIVRFSGPFACRTAFSGSMRPRGPSNDIPMALGRNGLRRASFRAKTIVNFGAGGNRMIRTHITSSFVDPRRTVQGLGRLNNSDFRMLMRGNGRT